MLSFCYGILDLCFLTVIVMYPITIINDGINADIAISEHVVS